MMKHSLIYTAIITVIVGLTGCGGSDSDDTSQNTEQGSNNTNNGSNLELTEAQRQKILDVSKETTSISLKEALLLGVVDTLVYGTDEADADEKCSSGSYTKAGDMITFNNCKGLFKAATGLNQYQDLTVNGQVIVKENSFEYQNLILLDSNSGESKTVTGTLKFSSGSTEEVITDSLKIKATEKNGTAFADVNYTLENYKLNYDKKSGSELSLSTSGTLKATNSSVGDYKINFETAQPLFVQIDAKNDDAIVSYPYAGVLKITDLADSATTTLTANNDKKTALLSVMAGQKELVNGTQNWADILGYSK
ncbi:hypothetical protein MKX17_13155 [Acinetobacter ursingii]|uniref:hypothetical protein n=2 Tax=Acinetobacter ursingii TaxID=108980 RepID=UPI00148F26A7|nr:hypothetical protein [Acinetobacter ursingii]MCH2016861.1 hypothetical protein [Acinetobacter ursingii]MCU4589697.1 hypothetical protein [Acinetobacter ursingii]